MKRIILLLMVAALMVAMVATSALPAFAQVRPPAEDSDALMDLFAQSEAIYFDLEREVLIFGDISLKGGD